MFSVAPSPEATKSLPPPPSSDFTAREITREPLPAAPTLETLKTLEPSPPGMAATSLRYMLAPIHGAPPDEPPEDDSGGLPWVYKLPQEKRGASAGSGGAKPEKEGGGGVFGGRSAGVMLDAGVRSAAYGGVKPEVAAGAALDLSGDSHSGGGRRDGCGGVGAGGNGPPLVPGAATLFPEDVCLVKDSFGEIHVVRPVPNYSKIHGQSFESEAGAKGAAHDYRRKERSLSVTVEDFQPDEVTDRRTDPWRRASLRCPSDLARELAAAGSDAPGGSTLISTALSTALARVRAQAGAGGGGGGGAPRAGVVVADSVFADARSKYTPSEDA
ncbi:hypothetical protein T484DRAFT_1840241 [Baffinella frigidus]|nr:hypothetical protein T484DRAFT_1840241 [Cryptophyta sp. CCMP2293]